MDELEGRTSTDEDGIGVAWSLLRSMKDDGNVPASDYYDQLVQLKDALHGACAKKMKNIETNHQTRTMADGLPMAAAASGMGSNQISHAPSLAPKAESVPQLPTTNKHSISDGDALHDPFLNGLFSQSASHPQGQSSNQTSWAPAALDSMFSTSTTEQLLWDFDWESVGIL